MRRGEHCSSRCLRGFLLEAAAIKVDRRAHTLGPVKETGEALLQHDCRARWLSI
jgi:hypothetical protein